MRHRLSAEGDNLQKAKTYAKELERQGKNLERTVNELGRKSNLQEEEMNELKNMYDNERRKSMAVEKSIGQMQNENRNLHSRIRDLEHLIDDEKSNSTDL